MNYINQIRGFWRAHEEHSFSTTEVAVYFYLLEVCNICHWKNPFKRNNAKIEADLGISFNTLKNARNRLAQTGLLSFKTTNGSPNVVYTLSNFDKVTNKVTNEVTDEVTDEVGDEVLTTKDKQNETETNLPPNPPSGGEGVEEISESDVKISESDVKIPEKEKSCAKKEKAPPHNFDFVADEFREPFIRFIEYRKNIRRPYRSQQGIETCYRQLMGFCNGDPAVAEQIVEQSIANEWQGLFKLQTQTNGTKKTINQRLSVGKQDYGEDTI
jgi:predicted transcriptional regulator